MLKLLALALTVLLASTAAPMAAASNHQCGHLTPNGPVMFDVLCDRDPDAGFQGCAVWTRPAVSDAPCLL